MAGADPIPCAVHRAAAEGRYIHPEGVCACFRGGPAPVLIPTGDRAALADRPGVFDTSWISADGDRWRHPWRTRVRNWLRRRQRLIRAAEE